MATAAPAASSSSKSKLKPQHHLMSGALSGLSSAIVLQPLDLLKTRLQQSTADTPGIKGRRIRNVARQVLRDDGIRGLWRGTVPTLARNVPGVAIYFYSLSAIRDRLSLIPYFAITVPAPLHGTTTDLRPGKGREQSAIVKLSSGGNLMAGAVGRTSVGFILSPITVVKARFESNRYKSYHSITGALASLYRTHGIKGFFQGFTATAARDAPYAGLYLVFYEKWKEFAGKIPGIPNAALYSGSGVVAATLATIITSPADVIKTRMQVNPVEHPSIRTAITRVISERGAMGFFSGTSLRVSRKAASGAIGWTVYEGLLLFIRDRDGRLQQQAQLKAV